LYHMSSQGVSNTSIIGWVLCCGNQQHSWNLLCV
jgi:hypothetical protein